MCSEGPTHNQTCICKTPSKYYKRRLITDDALVSQAAGRQHLPNSVSWLGRVVHGCGMALLENALSSLGYYAVRPRRSATRGSMKLGQAEPQVDHEG